MREFLVLVAIVLTVVIGLGASAPRGVPIPVADCIGCG
jgi:hypothetical protein